MSNYKDRVQELPWMHSPWHVEEAHDAVRDADGHLVCAVANSALAELIAEAGTVLHETGLTPRELAEQRDRLLAALKEIADISERPFDDFPADWSEQIKSCAECQKYASHPIQRGICNDHRQPLYRREKHDEYERSILGIRAKSIASAAIAKCEGGAQ